MVSDTQDTFQSDSKGLSSHIRILIGYIMSSDNYKRIFTFPVWEPHRNRLYFTFDGAIRF